ncbi:hypothetical protein ACQPZJ_07955 [Actinoplanes sp. CA-054009]
MSLAALDVTVGRDRKAIGEHSSLDVPEGRPTAIIGPDACGKRNLVGRIVAGWWA